MVLLYFFNKHINYLAFKAFLPTGLLRPPYKGFTPTEVSSWMFILKWLIPGIVVITFMKVTNFAQRVNYNWGVIAVSIVVFIKVSLMIIQPTIYYLVSQVQGGGASYVSSNFFRIIHTYLNIPLRLLLLAGTLKIFLTLKPVENTP
jgi:hypothetical protein